MSPFTEARMHLGIELGGAGHHPARPAGPGRTRTPSAGVRHHLALVLAAARRGLDFVALPEPPAGGPDALALATRIAPLAGGVGLVAAATIAGAEPERLAAAIAGLDAASGGGPAGSRAPGSASGRGSTRSSSASHRVGSSRWSCCARTTPTRCRSSAGGRRRPGLRGRPRRRRPRPQPRPRGGRRRRSQPGRGRGHARRRGAPGRRPAPRQADLLRLDAVQAADPSSVRVLGTAADLADLIGATLRLGAADGITLLPWCCRATCAGSPTTRSRCWRARPAAQRLVGPAPAGAVAAPVHKVSA
jgi:hypothetical protein